MLARLRGIPVHLWVAASAWGSRLVSSAAQLVSVSILLSYLGTEQYAAYAVIASLMGWFALVEFGLGPSLQNFISEARAQDRSARAQIQAAALVVPALFVISVIILLVIAVPLQGFILRELGEEIPRQPTFLVGLIGLIYIVTTLGSIAYRVFYGEQRGYLAHIYQGLASLLGLAALWLLATTHDGGNRLLYALLVWTSPHALLAVFAYIQVFSRQRLSELPRWPQLRPLLGRAYRFGIFALLAAATLLIDYIVMSQTLGAEAITQYNIISKVFGLIFFVYNALLMAVWPVLAELLAKENWARAGAIITRYVWLGFAVIALGTVGFLASRGLLMNLLAPEAELILPSMTIILFGVYFLLRIWTDTYAMALQSISHLSVFWIYVPFQAAIGLVGQYFLSREIGLNGIVLGLILSFLLTTAWALPREFERLKGHKLVEVTA